MNGDQALAVAAAVLVGGIVGTALAALARELQKGVSAPRTRRDLRLDPAMVIGAAMPAAAVLLLPTTDSAAGATLVGWLLLGIAVCDERTFLIPHAFWMAGIPAALLLAWSAGGWTAVEARILTAAVLLAGFLAAARVARVLAGRPAVGGGDYGVVAFVGSLCGPASPDVLLVGGVIALGCHVSACSSASGGTEIDGRSGLPAPRIPFGACLALAVVLVVLGGSMSFPGFAAIRSDLLLRQVQPVAP